MKIKNNIGYLGFVLLSCLLVACNEQNQQAKTESDWVKDEILQQLVELRKDVKLLKADIAKLDDKVSNLNQRPVGAGTKPGPKKVKLPKDFMLGDPNAKIALIEFTDYQCPFCARHNKQVLPQIKKHFIDTNKIKYGLFDFPLSFHAQGKPAAIAARCAGKQDKYWQMHEKLFQAPGRLNQDYYIKLADELELNIKQFNACLQDKEILKKVEEDIRYGKIIGVSGTPKFFVGKINGNDMENIIVISGAQDFDTFKNAIIKLQ